LYYPQHYGVEMMERLGHVPFFSQGGSDQGGKEKGEGDVLID
jgi:hypothetical protein